VARPGGRLPAGHTRPSRGPDAAVQSGMAAPPVRPSAPWSAGGPEPSGASQRDPVITFGGQQSEPLSSTPVASREAATTAAVEALPPPAPRKWSWPELMRHTFAVDVLACPPCGGRMQRGRHNRGPRRHPEDSHPPSGSRPWRRRPGRRRPICSTGAEVRLPPPSLPRWRFAGPGPPPGPRLGRGSRQTSPGGHPLARTPAAPRARRLCVVTEEAKTRRTSVRDRGVL
jgi:hypothetical protein